MRDRSANATIKGYLYQFNRTIFQLLSAEDGFSTVVIEGIEDIDLEDKDLSYVQCKYYEKTSYNHSEIKDAIVSMLRHFCSNQNNSDKEISYSIYGHYKDGQEKLPESFSLDFMKRTILTYNRSPENGGIQRVHEELNVDDEKLEKFISKLNVNIYALSYEQQFKENLKLLSGAINGYGGIDIELFLYPRALNVIQELAIKSSIADRTITKNDFIDEIDKKEIVFTHWLKLYYEVDRYAKVIRKQYFKSTLQKMPNKSRVFILDFSKEFKLSSIVSTLIDIGKLFSHAEHTRTPDNDRFCPYIVLINLADNELVKIKDELYRCDVKFIDGYPYKGSEFRPSDLVIKPSKDNSIKLKFIPDVDRIAPVIEYINGSQVEVYDFYKDSIQDFDYKDNVFVGRIKVDSMYFIDKVMK